MGEKSMVARIGLILVGVLLIGAAVAGYYGSTRPPAQRSFEQVLPDDRFPH